MGAKIIFDNNNVWEGDANGSGQMLRYDSRGQYIGQKVTYRASTQGVVTLVSGTAPFFTIYGSATKTVRIQRIFFTGTIATTAANAILNLNKYSTARSGGTASAITATPLDSASGAATVTDLQLYTAAPTAGTLVGTIEARRCLLNVTGAVATQDVLFDFRNVGENEALVLRGTTQGIGLLFQTAPGNAVAGTLWVEWTEE